MPSDRQAELLAQGLVEYLCGGKPAQYADLLCCLACGIAPSRTGIGRGLDDRSGHDIRQIGFRHHIAKECGEVSSSAIIFIQDGIRPNPILVEDSTDERRLYNRDANIEGTNLVIQ